MKPVNHIGRLHFIANFDIDFKFWALLPAFNINIHSPGFEIEWLCFALYVDIKKENNG